ncbi:CHAD domain-containing protein [Paraburkholderia phymatum]|uniref:CHAD domain containing protein n=1 Tax=Paraburkholderia phymatum (strain DSM 17167 / CIP 108236 / LMG 21445 / STM815) TaxID=391038 RepID=B2JPA6_PARP8|nr:CHAD domain-containing protein [Paraburkholderia phymatum]ACC73109.1 CHAD domain containing protein [Paraburkholderia phymatum STM815]
MKAETLNGLPHDGTAQAHFSHYAAPLIDNALACAGALHSNPDAEVLHKLRVSLRRLRTLLWAYRPLLDEQFDNQQRALFKFYASAAGKTRDWDILIALLGELGDAQERPVDALQAARSKSFDTSRATLEQADVKRALRDTLKEANRELNTAHERTPLPKFARKRLAAAQKSMAKRMKRAARAKRSDYASYHEVRKAGKKLRYLTEFFEPMLAKKQLKAVKPLKKLQKRFGALNDVVASEQLLRDNQALYVDEAAAAQALDALSHERKRRMRNAGKLL